MSQVIRDYPWTQFPLITSAPMRLIALAPLAAAVSGAGGLGFIGMGNDASELKQQLSEARTLMQGIPSLRGYLTSPSPSSPYPEILPIGVGFLLWAGDTLLQTTLAAIAEHAPAAVWLFAPSDPSQLTTWAREIRRVTQSRTKVWVQVGTVAQAVEAVERCRPEVLVVQGQDAGGHGLEVGAGVVALMPEVEDAVVATCARLGLGAEARPVLIATGGIMDGRGVAAASALGAAGVSLGTRYLACPEANLARGYRDAVLAATDGGVTTARGKLYDTLRGTTDWPAEYAGRGVLNESYHDARKGMGMDENKRLYDEAMKKGDDGWGANARLTTYAGTGVGLAKTVMPAAQITEEVREDAKRVLNRLGGQL